MKNASSSIATNHCEMVIEALGQQGLGWDGDDFTAEELTAARAYLRIKSSTIAGGSYEIQNNIISKRILGLPDTNKHTY
jgi:alkylation response protein AidB-like acyl-CoA dehydrogenase